ncbi:hypothetical protein [Methylobacterium sp. Gmos1]
MLTADQHGRLPTLLRDIVDHDRHTAAIARAIRATRVIHISFGTEVRRRREVRASMSESARHLYGRVPLRGDTGPGRPTAARA